MTTQNKEQAQAAPESALSTAGAVIARGDEIIDALDKQCDDLKRELAQATAECDLLRSATYKANKRADEAKRAGDALAEALRGLLEANSLHDETAVAALAQYEEAKK